jgi:hypothetical protein
VTLTRSVHQQAQKSRLGLRLWCLDVVAPPRVRNAADDGNEWNRSDKSTPVFYFDLTFYYIKLEGQTRNGWMPVPGKLGHLFYQQNYLEAETIP